MRITGRPICFQSYRSSHAKLCEGMFPSLPHIDSFLDFVSENGLFRKLFGHQHLGAIPSALRRNFACFQKFIRSVAGCCDEFCLKLFRLNKREDAVFMLSQELHNKMDECREKLNNQQSNQKIWEFLSHQIISDLEEIIDSPFGIVTADSVVLGHGSKNGWLCIDTTTCGIPCNLTGASLEKLTNRIEECIRKYSDDGKLVNKVLGLRRDSSTGLSVFLNGRRLNAVDTEHILCKIYLGVVHTIGSRARSRQPRSWLPGMHPIAEIDNRRFLDDDCNKVFERCERAFKNGCIPKPPDSMLLLAEVFPIEKKI